MRYHSRHRLHALYNRYWTSRSDDAYLSLTCHFITTDYKMCYQNLQTCHFPGIHDFSHIAEAISAAAKEWCINIDKQVIAFTTDSRPNIAKAVEEMGVLHLLCAGHTMNLGIQKAFKVHHSHREMSEISCIFP